MSSKLMVRSLPWSLREDRLRALFQKFGDMTECKVIMDRDDPNRSRGFGFITFQDPKAADEAILSMDNYSVDGRNIRVQFADRGGGARDNDRGDHRENDRSRDTRERSPGRDRGRDRDRRDSRRDDRRDDRWDDRRDNRRDDRRDDRRNDRRENQGRNGRHSHNDPDVKRNIHGGGVEEALDPTSTNGRIYITGIPQGTTEDEIAQHFGMLGVVARKRQKRGYPDQWPFKVSIYLDDTGKPKGDAALTYVDPNAAQSAPQFFNNTEFKGSKITVELAKQAVSDSSGSRDYGKRGNDRRGGYNRRR